jgi:diacylglycerol kinase family enzyme
MPLIYCIANGHKKISARNQGILDGLKQYFGAQFQIYTSNEPSDAQQFIHSLNADCTHLIALGGDGTFNVLINSVCTHPQENFSPILGIIPNGTGNDFYRSAGFAETYNLKTSILSGVFEHFDIGLIETAHEKRYFANITDVGFGGAVVLELQQFRKNFGPNFSYGLAIIKTFFHYKRPTVSIKALNYSYKGELLLAAFCNGSIFGDGLHIHPGASIFDGSIKLTLLGKVSLFDYLKNVVKVKRGKKIKHTEAHYINIAAPILLSADKQMLHAETDGEYISGKEFRIDLIAGKLKLLSPTML